MNEYGESRQPDSVDHLAEQGALDRDQAAHKAKARDAELRICLGDSWELIQAKLDEYEATINARLESVERRLTAYQAQEKAVTG